MTSWWRTDVSFAIGLCDVATAGKVKITVKGPLFSTARRTAALAALKPRILDSVTKNALKSVSGILARRIKHPTPYYQLLIRQDVISDSRWQVTDGGGFGGVVYNYWLEGTGSRNYPVTKFKGYHAWKLSYERVSRRAPKLAQTQVGRIVRRLGGRVTVAGEAE